LRQKKDREKEQRAEIVNGSICSYFLFTHNSEELQFLKIMEEEFQQIQMRILVPET